VTAGAKTEADYAAEMAWIGRAMALRDDDRFTSAERVVLISLTVDPLMPLDECARCSSLTRDEVDRAVSSLISPPAGSQHPAMLAVDIDSRGRAVYRVRLDAVT
jgi:hypothetical protein